MTGFPRRARADDMSLARALGRLSSEFADRFTTNESLRRQHGNQLSEVPNAPPDAVVFPRSTEEIAAIVRICGAEDVPIIPFGVGTSFEGHINAPFGGVSLDTSLMKAVKAIHAADLDVFVEAGVTRNELNQELKSHGLHFPIDPGADATLGGMAATRASGTNAVRYGTMKDNVLDMTVVLASGETIRTGTRARKSSAGYDLTRLMIGSEGTLGLIADLTLRVQGLPEAIVAAVCPFPSVRAACEAVIETMQAQIPVARIELLDALQVSACRAYSKLDLPDAPMLFVEFQGSPIATEDAAEAFATIARDHGAKDLARAARPEDRTRLWKARHDAYWAARALRPSAKGVSTDVCVPISELAATVEETRQDALASGILAPIVGHVGDGNFHVMPLIDFDNPQEVERGQAFIDRLVRRALDHGGTSTGEHGLGETGLKYFAWEWSAATREAMRAIKRALDPNDILNPGKLPGS
jgi:D-lactate dehydrogenase (cytochrome)